MDTRNFSAEQKDKLTCAIYVWLRPVAQKAQLT